VLINRNGSRANDFGELASGHAAEEIHLPKAILGHDVALRFRHVRERRSAYVRDSPDVAVHGHLRLQTRERCGAVQLRKRTEEEPPNQAAAHDENQGQKPADDAKSESQAKPRMNQ